MTSTFEIESTLKALRKKKLELALVLEGAKQTLVTLKLQKDLEEADVKKLEADKSFMASLLKVLHLYEGQLTKETEEYLQAKLEYERQATECLTIKKHLQAIEARIFDTELELKHLSESLSQKERLLSALSTQAPQKVLFEKMSHKHALLKQEAIEIQEAKRALEQAEVCLFTTKGLLNKDWSVIETLKTATLTDEKAYAQMDLLKSKMEQLSTLLKCFHRELIDVSTFPQLALQDMDQWLQLYDQQYQAFLVTNWTPSGIFSQLGMVQNIEEKLHLLSGQLHLKADANDANMTAVSETLEHILIEIEME